MNQGGAGTPDRTRCIFSRAPIPYARDAFAASKEALPPGLPVHRRHVGIYAYRAGFLRQYGELPACGQEQFEALEQLRVLWHGYSISVHLYRSGPCRRRGYGGKIWKSP